jgi:phosphoglycolate phosphatase-like HAD superfamily hydrolase
MRAGVFAATCFDSDGVLGDDEPVHRAAIREALQPRGIGVADQDYWEQYMGVAVRQQPRSRPIVVVSDPLCAVLKRGYARLYG